MGKKDDKLTLAEVASTYGSMNDLQIGDTPLADRRSLNTTRAISALVEKHYTPNVLKDKDTFLGIVLASIPSTVARVGSKSQQFEVTGKKLYSSRAVFYIYKVLIPELESRCLNFSTKGKKKDNPLILAEAARISTMQDVTLDVTMYDQSAAIRAIEPGTLVKIAYEDLARMQGPKVVAIYKKIFNFEATSSGGWEGASLTEIWAGGAKGTVDKPPPSKHEAAKTGAKLVYTGVRNLKLSELLPTLAAVFGLDAGHPMASKAIRAGSEYGSRDDPLTPGQANNHRGQDFAVNHGTPIVAPAAGTVTFIKSRISPSAGWYIEIYHGEWKNPKNDPQWAHLTEDSYGVYTRYLHTRSKGNETGAQDKEDTPLRASSETTYDKQVHHSEGKRNGQPVVYLHPANKDAESDFEVKVGQEIKKGDVIGYVGNTGGSTGTHLHYEVKISKKLRGEKNEHVQAAISVPPYAREVTMTVEEMEAEFARLEDLGAFDEPEE